MEVFHKNIRQYMCVHLGHLGSPLKILRKPYGPYRVALPTMENAFALGLLFKHAWKMARD
jgi:hypothetical protein